MLELKERVVNEPFQACKTCDSPGSTTCTTSGQDGAGVPDADFVVYVAARPFSCGATTLAYAAHCFQDKSTDRYSHRPLINVVRVRACVHVCVCVCVCVSAS